ncbi:uncharacterized protein LOC120076165 [Benincasa hispida]|uniref:uncharacterized protein LOC120076165 n=1 Tax=Benincasa hispida TaxID=102211 RepID=UPI0019029309|nr:uncharacterized protein LOC120076165 [Benincasa hispida]
MFTLPCKVGDRIITHAMLDLGASINVTPFHVHEDLADRLYIQPLDIVEDLLLRVGELIFLVDFYILKLDEPYSTTSSNILLGRPFMETAKTRIDVDKGSLLVEFDGEVKSFNIYDAMKFPEEYLYLCSIDTCDMFDEFLFSIDENLDCLVAPSIDHDDDDSLIDSFFTSNDFDLNDNSSNNDVVESQVQGIELKALPSHLKYVFLGEDKAFSVIKSRELTSFQECSLVETLKDHKKEIG